MKKLFVVFFVTCSAALSAQDMTKKDAPEFIVDMADSRMATREAGRIASSLGTTKEIRDFGNQLMHDEETMLAKVKQLAASKNITLPNAIGHKRAEAIRKLSGLTGRKFDKKFLKAVKANYKHDIRWFKKAAEFEDAATREFASSNLSALERQLQRAKNL